MPSKFTFGHLLWVLAAAPLVVALVTHTWSVAFTGAAFVSAVVASLFAKDGSRDKARRWKLAALALVVVQCSAAFAVDQLWARIVVVGVSVLGLLFYGQVAWNGTYRPRAVEATPGSACISPFVDMIMAVQARDVNRYTTAYIKFRSADWSDLHAAVLLSAAINVRRPDALPPSSDVDEASRVWQAAVVWLEGHVPAAVEVRAGTDPAVAIGRMAGAIVSATPDERTVAAVAALCAAAGSTLVDLHSVAWPIERIAARLTSMFETAAADANRLMTSVRDQHEAATSRSSAVVDLERVTATGEHGSLDRLLPVELTKAALLVYLRGCPVVLSARTMVPDRFDPAAKRIPLTWCSDGVFTWSAETAAYVERYDMGLPARFVAHVTARNAVVPSFTDTERATLVDAFRAGNTQVAGGSDEVLRRAGDGA